MRASQGAFRSIQHSRPSPSPRPGVDLCLAAQFSFLLALLGIQDASLRTGSDAVSKRTPEVSPIFLPHLTPTPVFANHHAFAFASPAAGQGRIGEAVGVAF